MQENQQVTAKAKVQSKNTFGSDQAQVVFVPDYQDNRNSEWAVATPALNLSMTVRPEIADMFEHGECVDLIIRRNPDQGGASQGEEQDQASDMPQQAGAPEAEQA